MNEQTELRCSSMTEHLYSMQNALDLSPSTVKKYIYSVALFFTIDTCKFVINT
jgi:hypothetical protein